MGDHKRIAPCKDTLFPLKHQEQQIHMRTEEYATIRFKSFV